MSQFQKAIRFATTAHTGQARKGKPLVPYITHPLGVALILARVGASEDVITAGILHDTVEDSGGKITLDDIALEFGEAVAELVGHVTEPDHDTLPWAERKEAARAHVLSMPKEALLLKSADFLHNISDLLIDLEEEGEDAWKCFSAPKEPMTEHLKKLAESLSKAWSENPLLGEVRDAVGRLR
ncbi:MAG: HD domain-containing protein [bacterium]|nr:HD domain-containing protein [bacterium]